MTFEALLDQTIVLVRTATSSQNEIGELAVATETTTSVAAYIYPISGEEDRLNRNTQIGNWRALIPPGTDVDGADRVEWDGRTFDVVAPPEPVRVPRTGEEHHIRLRLQEVV